MFGWIYLTLPLVMFNGVCKVFDMVHHLFLFVVIYFLFLLFDVCLFLCLLIFSVATNNGFIVFDVGTTKVNQ